MIRSARIDLGIHIEIKVDALRLDKNRFTRRHWAVGQVHYPGEEEAMFEKLSAAQPVGRMGKPEELAALAAFLCSDEAGFITGGAYDIDGGFTQLR